MTVIKKAINRKDKLDNLIFSESHILSFPNVLFKNSSNEVYR